MQTVSYFASYPTSRQNLPESDIMPIPASSPLLVIGGTGFIGTHLAEALVERGHTLTLPTRHREKVREDLIPLPGVTVVEADVHHQPTLNRLMEGQAAVINLVGVLHGSPAAFTHAHVALTEKIVVAAKLAGVQRYLHMSALGADVNGASHYQRSKGIAETRVAASGIPYTVYRPSLVFGDGKCFLSLLASLLAVAPVLPLAGAQCKVQPVWVGDVVRALLAGLSRDDLLGKTLSLVGPRTYSLQQLVEYIGEAAGTPRPVIALPDGLARLQAALMSLLPRPLLSADNLDTLKVDNIDPAGFPAELGWQPMPLETIAQTLLARRNPRARYLDYRSRAGRRE